jgi:molybdopterin converting factor small subunit
MPVTVRLFAAARAAAGTNSLTVEHGSLAQAIHELLGHHPALADVLPRCSFLLNGVAVHGDKTAVTLEPGSELDVLPPFAGG